MSTSRWLMCFLSLGVMGSGNAAPPVAHQINASSVGTGVGRGINWTTEGQQSPVWCGSACSYQRVSAVKIAPDLGTTYLPLTWLGNSTTTFPNPVAVARSIPTPVGAVDSAGRPIVYESSAYERAAMDVFRDGQSLTATVYQSGNQGASQSGIAAAVLAYPAWSTEALRFNEFYYHTNPNNGVTTIIKNIYLETFGQSLGLDADHPNATARTVTIKLGTYPAGKALDFTALFQVEAKLDSACGSDGGETVCGGASVKIAWDPTAPQPTLYSQSSP